MRTSIVIPTLNEAGNITELLPLIKDCMGGMDYGIVVVDDNSSDGTQNVVMELGKWIPVELLERKGKKGLASAVIDGIEYRAADSYIVIDADLSHPSVLLPMIKHLLDTEYDLVVASRYVKGGGISNWPVSRLFTSVAANVLARGLTPVKDATSGFFGVRAKCLEGVRLEGLGYKIGLEIFVKGRWKRYIEVPYVFKDRVYGSSKLGKGVVVDYIRHLVRLYRWKVEHRGK